MFTNQNPVVTMTDNTPGRTSGPVHRPQHPTPRFRSVEDEALIERAADRIFGLAYLYDDIDAGELAEKLSDFKKNPTPNNRAILVAMVEADDIITFFD